MNNLNFLKRPTILPIFHLMSKKSCGQKSLYSCQKSRLWCCRHTRIDLHFQMQSSTSHSKCTDLRWRPFSLINLIFYLTSVLVMILNFFFYELDFKKVLQVLRLSLWSIEIEHRQGSYGFLLLCSLFLSV